MTDELRAVVAKADEVMRFLIGFQEIDGLSFGEPHPTVRGNFWWRSVHLPKINDALNNALTLADENDRLRAELAAVTAREAVMREALIRLGTAGGAVVDEIPCREVSYALYGGKEKVTVEPDYGWAGRENCQELNARIALKETNND